MGLSSEERVSKTYWQLMWWRRSLVALHEAMPHEWSHQRTARTVVNSWIGRVDLITGRLIAKRDANGAYWILGSSDDNYRSHFDVLEVFNEPQEKRAEYNSHHAFENMDIVEFVRRLSEGTHFESPVRDRARVVAAWWTAWQHIDALLYPVYRYDDGLFPASFHDELCTLFGEIANRRYEIIEGGHQKDDVRDELLVEQAVLSKWKLFHIRLEQDDPWKKLTKKQRAGADHNKVLRHRPFPGYALIEEIGKMTLAQVAYALKKHKDDEYKRKNAWDKTQREQDAKKFPRIDGVLGPKMRSYEELERIVGTSQDRAEAIAAGEELTIAHGTHANWEAIVDERLGKLGPQRKAKKAAQKKDQKSKRATV